MMSAANQYYRSSAAAAVQMRSVYNPAGTACRSKGQVAGGNAAVQSVRYSRCLKDRSAVLLGVDQSDQMIKKSTFM